MKKSKELENHILTSKILDTKYLRMTLDDMDVELFEMAPYLSFEELKYRELVLRIYEKEYQLRTHHYAKIVNV